MKGFIYVHNYYFLNIFLFRSVLPIILHLEGEFLRRSFWHLFICLWSVKPASGTLYMVIPLILKLVFCFGWESCHFMRTRTWIHFNFVITGTVWKVTTDNTKNLFASLRHVIYVALERTQLLETHLDDIWHGYTY